MRRTTLTLWMLALSAAGLSTPALAADDPVAKPVKTVISAIRNSRDSMAIGQFAGEEQGKFLLGEQWEKGTPAQRKEFIRLFHTLFTKIAFPKVRENFQHLDQILYQPSKVDGDKAELGSVILINHPMKKQELKLMYSLVKVGSSWKVVDVTVLGDSMLKGIRDDQIRPILQEGGWDHLLELMRAKAKELGA